MLRRVDSRVNCMYITSNFPQDLFSGKKKDYEEERDA
jgi:hypothetical protein